MTFHSADSGAVIDLNVYGQGKTKALIKKKDEFEAIRLVVEAGKTIPPHKIEGALMVQCLSGSCIFSVKDTPNKLQVGSWLYLEGGTIHAVEAKNETAVLLLTCIFRHHNKV